MCFFLIVLLCMQLVTAEPMQFPDHIFTATKKKTGFLNPLDGGRKYLFHIDNKGKLWFKHNEMRFWDLFGNPCSDTGIKKIDNVSGDGNVVVVKEKGNNNLFFAHIVEQKGILGIFFHYKPREWHQITARFPEKECTIIDLAVGNPRPSDPEKNRYGNTKISSLSYGKRLFGISTFYALSGSGKVYFIDSDLSIATDHKWVPVDHRWPEERKIFKKDIAINSTAWTQPTEVGVDAEIDATRETVVLRHGNELWAIVYSYWSYSSDGWNKILSTSAPIGGFRITREMNIWFSNIDSSGTAGVPICYGRLDCGSVPMQFMEIYPCHQTLK